MNPKQLTLSFIATTALFNTSLFAENNELDPIVVSAEFRETKLSEISNAISVIGEEELYDKAFQNFEDVIGEVPNVNFTSGASRAHYIQIRGIGERSQFATPVNPSVGLNVDGIDFSQSALGVTLFDVAQIEVLKGPQGTTFGSNGMAGVVNIESNKPTKETQAHIEASYGNYNTKALGVAVGGTLIEDKLLGRISVYQNQSDGFTKNTYLNREDTNNIDELSTKAQLKWLVNDAHTIDLNFIHLDVDNGYDAFTLDNSRNSHADTPGKDTQLTDAFSLKSTYQVNSKMHLISKVSHSESDLEYSYDEDWSYDGEFSDDLYPYSSFDQYLRNRKQTDLDIRMVSDEDGKIFNHSTAWTIGGYYRDQDESLTRNYTYLENPYTSDYTTETKAIYGELDHAVTDKITLVAGLRLEQWDADFSDSDNVKINTNETLKGGKIGLNYQKDEDTLIYTTLSKGYKPGGVNADNSLNADAKEYATEALWNVDVGLNSSFLNNQISSRLNFFYGERINQQVKSSVVQVRDDGSTQYTDYLANAARSHYYGVEAEVDYFLNDNLHLFSNIGLLKSKFDKYVDPNPSAISMSGRTPAQSPSYQFNIGGDYMIAEAWTIKTNIEGKGSYYFSNRHNEKADAYQLINSSLEYTNDNFTATLWARNLTDTDYQVRGFGSFGNNPSKGYITELYTQQGSPRTFGATLAYDF
jgi:outer membrane receptor protein involved in Fe transport